MIGKLRGLVDSIEEDSLVLDVGGVGYHVFCSARTLAALPAIGEAAQIVIEMHVREDHIHLYGFPDTVEREWFRLLLTVQGVGNRIALAILSAYTPEQLSRAVLARDMAAFKAISGIGPRLAERIVTELKDKVGKLPTSEFQTTPKSHTASTSSPALEDAISALVNLGYSRSEAYAAATKAGQSGSGSIDQLIKLSLKELVRG